MTKVTILHQNRNMPYLYPNKAQALRALKDGYYYEAGELDIEIDVERNDDGIPMEVLEAAWAMSQNDYWPNEVVGGKTQPAVWNGLFPQRSSMVGDIFIVDGRMYRVTSAGFADNCGYDYIKNHHTGCFGINLDSNPYCQDDPQKDLTDIRGIPVVDTDGNVRFVRSEINKEFDDLVFLGD